MAGNRDALVSALLDRYGRTYAEEAGIKLADKPASLFQLLVLADLISARISAEIAVSAARELFAAGYTTPKAMRNATWQDRVDALGRAHYKRYDERTSTMLGQAAELLDERWGGDLRKLRDEASGQTRRIASLLEEFPGIGPSGASIFLREVQAVWPAVAPYVDDRVTRAARALGLPADADGLAGMTGSNQEFARLCAALIRVSLRKGAAEEIRETAGQAG